MTFPDLKHLSISALNVYGDFINRKHVKETVRGVKRWICEEYLAYSSFYHIVDVARSHESQSIEIEDILQYRWAKRLDFGHVDYWFIPLHHGVSFLLFVIDNVHDTYDYLHSTPAPNVEQVYEATVEKAINLIECFVEKAISPAKLTNGKSLRKYNKWMKLVLVCMF